MLLVGGANHVRRQGGLVATFEAINQRESRDISRTEWLAFADAVFGAAAVQFDEAAAADDDDADSYEDAGEVDGFVAALVCVGACGSDSVTAWLAVFWQQTDGGRP